jgi:ribonuclease D
VTRDLAPISNESHMHHEYVESPEHLARVVAELRDEPLLAVDTEAAGFHRYLDRISLLQISARPASADGAADGGNPSQRNFLVDPIALEDLSPLRPLFEDAAVEKVFHDADYDLRILHRDLGITVRNLFDTQIAAAFLGERSLGLGTIIDRFLGVHLPKAYQRADWAERPLNEGMKDYAVTDTAYLPTLRDRLRDALNEAGRLHWAEEEFLRRQDTRWVESEDSGDAFMRIKGARDLPPRGLAVLRELVAWRESVAKERDQAPFRVLANQTLLELSVKPPRTVQALRTVSGVSEGLLRHRGRDIVAAIQRALEVADDELPRFPTPRRWERDPDVEARTEALRDARNQAAEQLNLDPGFLMSRALLEEIAKRQPLTPEELREVPDVRNWQVEAVGAILLRALR